MLYQYRRKAKKPQYGKLPARTLPALPATRTSILHKLRRLQYLEYGGYIQGGRASWALLPRRHTDNLPNLLHVRPNGACADGAMNLPLKTLHNQFSHSFLLRSHSTRRKRVSKGCAKVCNFSLSVGSTPVLTDQNLKHAMGDQFVQGKKFAVGRGQSFSIMSIHRFAAGL